MKTNPNYFLLPEKDQYDFRMDFFYIDKNIKIFNEIIGKELIGYPFTDKIILELDSSTLDSYTLKKMELVKGVNNDI